jgi:hypothetical protein
MNRESLVINHFKAIADKVFFPYKVTKWRLDSKIDGSYTNHE